MKKVFQLGCTILAFMAITISFAEGKEHKLSDNDLNYIINVPDSAKLTHVINENGLVSLEITFPDKSVFMAAIMPIRRGQADARTIKPALLTQGAAFAKDSEEGKVKLLDLKRDGKIVGNYFSLTDKQPKEDEYKYMAQGVVDYNFVLGVFTYITNDKESWANLGGIDPVSLINDSLKDSVTKNFEKIKLTNEELSKFDLSSARHFYSRQQVILYNNTDIYTAILSNLEEKYTQSFSNGKENCTIFYYYFSDKLGENQRAFLRGLFYGEKGKPTKEHPETFLIKDNYLIVFSFPVSSKLHREIGKLIENKFKE